MIPTDMIFLELDRLEKFCDSYKEELRFLSTKIRCDIWKAGNESALAEILKALTDSLEKEYPDKNTCCIDMVIDYVYSLERYGIFINSDLNKEYFEKLIYGR